MTRSRARRPLTGETESHEAVDRAGSRVDAWIEAAIRKETSGPSSPPNLPAVDRDTASALGSFASWIEQAQRDLADSARATIEAQKEATAAIKGTVGHLEDRLTSVEQQFGRGPSRTNAVAPAMRGPDADGDAGSEFDTSLRSFETRLGQLTARVASPNPAARRSPPQAVDVSGAIAEIRSHQTRLDAAPARAERRTLPALGVLARSQTAILTSLKADIASLAHRLETRAQPVLDRPVEEPKAAPDPDPDVVRRGDLGRLEEGIRTLAADIADLRVATEAAAGSPELRALQAEIRRMADQAQAPDEHPTARELELLSNKLDIVAASGVDPGAVDTLTRQVADVRQILLDAGTPQLGVESQLADLRRDLASLGERQLDVRAFETLAANVDDVRASLTSRGQSSAGGHEAAARAVREIGQPIETMLTALVDRLERIERRMADPDALNHLELQIGELSARMSGSSTGDPALSSLERSVSELMAQLSGWRQGTAEIAEHAARAAVAEMVGSAPLASTFDRQLAALHDQYDAIQVRTGESLASVQSTLGQVMNRLADLEMPAATSQGGRAGDPSAVVPPPRRPSRAARPQPTPPAEPPSRAAPGPAPEDEILLEPGSARPRRAASGGSDAASTGGNPDVKANFIAAARRAAQAAATESAVPRKTAAPSDKPAGSSILSPGELAGRIRDMIEARRRPLLLGVAALVLAVGSLHIWRNAATAPSAPATIAAAPSPQAAMPPQAPGATAPKAVEQSQDPSTTQSLAERGGAPRAQSPISPPTTGEPRADAVPPGPGEATRMAAVPASPAIAPPAALTIPKPQPDQGAPVSAGLRQAASAGHPVALYDLAVRTSEGRGVPRDLKAAAALFQKAAEKNLVPAQYRIGNIYEKGVGVTRDVDAAKTWYRRAAENGNVRAMHNLAVLIAEGAGGKPDYAAALGWFTKAAEHGVRDSQFNLAVLHARGLGTTQDLSKTYFWLAVAAGQGDEDAARKRDEVGARLQVSELAKVKANVERWKPGTPNAAANEVQVPETWPEAAPAKRAKEARI